VIQRVLLLFALGLAVACLVAAAGAEQPRTVPVVGILFAAAGPDDPLIEALRRGLRELGYVEGQNIRFEFRGAQGQDDRLPRLARELVQLKVDVIFAGTAVSIRAAKQATSTIPIVALMHDQDPVTSGLIESFNRPGGNITGIYQRQQELAGKRLELLKEALPNLSTVAVFWDACCAGELAELKRAARSLGIKLELIQLRAPYDFERAFTIAKQKKAGAVIVMFSAGFYVQRARIGTLALENGLPAMGQLRDLTEAGGLMSYGHETRDSFFRFAYFIDRLLKGAKPGDIPVEQVATFKLVVNLRTARALGLTVPQSVLLRADEVIR
jgi:putative ABC transport system substrate-binding protein